jgi:hypothetical protein
MDAARSIAAEDAAKPKGRPGGSDHWDNVVANINALWLKHSDAEKQFSATVQQWSASMAAQLIAAHNAAIEAADTGSSADVQVATARFCSYRGTLDFRAPLRVVLFSNAFASRAISRQVSKST